MRRSFVLSLAVATLLSVGLRADFVAGFEDQGLAANSHNNNAGNAGGFTSGNMFFSNSFSIQNFGGTNYEIWSGFAISNRAVTVSESVTAASTNEYSDFQFDAYPGSGAAGTPTYAVGFSTGFMNLPAGKQAYSIDIANTLYDYLAMLKGNRFSTAFHAGSFFSVTLSGYAGLGATGASLGTPVSIDLARYVTDTDHPLQGWSTINLTPLSGAKSIGFSFSSSDTGDFGINTPLYFALDNLRVVPEPASWVLGLIGGTSLWVLARRRV